MKVEINLIAFPEIKEEKKVKQQAIIDTLILLKNNKRQSSKRLKTRAEVRGGGRKPWRQKGTGRARHGSIRSPIWVGGGRPFASSRPNYKSKINKKVKAKVTQQLFEMISQKQKSFLVDLKNFTSPSTKEMALSLKSAGLQGKGLFLYHNRDANDALILSIRNIPFLNMKSIENISSIDLISANWILLEENAYKNIKEKYFNG